MLLLKVASAHEHLPLSLTIAFTQMMRIRAAKMTYSRLFPQMSFLPIEVKTDARYTAWRTNVTDNPAWMTVTAIVAAAVILSHFHFSGACLSLMMRSVHVSSSPR